jgi:hypothetical protein
LGVLAVYLILAFLKLPNYSILWLEIHNTGHTPLFGLLALFILGISLSHIKSIHHRLVHYIIAFFLSSFCGLLLEIWQIWGPGDADIIDLVRDIAGAFSFLAIYSMFDVGWGGVRDRLLTGRKILVGSLGVLVLIGALTPLAFWTTAYIMRNRNFPEIIAFESPIERKFARVQNASFNIVDSPAAWKEKRGRVGMLVLKKSPYPGIAVREPYPDWSGYRNLKLEVYLAYSKPLNCTLRIHDIRHNDDYHDRFNGPVSLIPGPNEITIRLSDVRKAPEKRMMNMKAIRSLMLFAHEAVPACTLYIANIRLE